MNNLGQVTDKTYSGDERYTPFYAVDPLIEFLSKDQIIWCPFDEDWSAFPIVLRKNGFTVVNSCLSKGQNFFNFEPDRWDILISNPPFSKKSLILDRVMSFNKPYALLLPFDILQAKAYYNFISNKLQLLLFDGRIKYFSAPNFREVQSGISFGSAFFCKDFLPADIVTRRLIEKDEPLLSEKQAKEFNIPILGDYVLDMFSEETYEMP